MDNAQKYQGQLQRLVRKLHKLPRYALEEVMDKRFLLFPLKKKWNVEFIHKDRDPAWDPASPTNRELSLQNIDNFAPHNSRGSMGKKLRSMF